MTGAPAVIAADFDTLRCTAQLLRDAANELADRRASLAALKAQAHAEASAGTTTGRPAPVYGPLLRAFDTAITTIDTALTQFSANVHSDARALDNVADRLAEETKQAAAAVNAMTGTTADAKLR